jgi:hypothetical protein
MFRIYKDQSIQYIYEINPQDPNASLRLMTNPFNTQISASLSGFSATSLT